MKERDLLEIKKAHGLPEDATVEDICERARTLRQTEMAAAFLLPLKMGPLPRRERDASHAFDRSRTLRLLTSHNPGSPEGRSFWDRMKVIPLPGFTKEEGEPCAS